MHSGAEGGLFHERWYQNLMEVSPVGIFFTDAGGNCVHTNQRWCEIAGISLDEARGTGWIEAIHKEDLDRVVDLWYEAARSNQDFHTEYRFCRPDGTVTWVVGDGRTIFAEDGTVEGHVGTITDISQIRQAYQDLEDSHTRIRTIIEKMPVLLFAFDGQDCLCAWNREAERITGYAAAEMIGNPDAMRLLCPDPDYLQSMLEAYKRAGDDYLNWEWQLTAKDGSVKIVSFSNIASRYPVKGWSNWGVGVDVTAFRKAEHELAERLKELSCLYKLSLLSSRHNLNLESFFQEVVELLPPSWQYPEITCARIIYQDRFFRSRNFKSSPWKLSSGLFLRGHRIGLVEVFYKQEKPKLVEGPFLAEERMLLDEIALQLSRTINHVYDRDDLALLGELNARTGELEQFSHSVSHDLRTPLTAIGGFSDLMARKIQEGDFDTASECAQRVVATVERMEKRLNEILKLAKIGKIIEPDQEVSLGELIEETLEMMSGRLEKHQISVQLEGEFPTVLGDRIRLTEVIENLLENAIKYIGEPPNRITIGCRWVDDQPVIYVLDNGIGLDPQHFDDVFQIFWRFDKSSPGDGTGLAIAKRIIEAHGGRIWVESPGQGKGCCFSFTLGQCLKGGD